MVGGDQELTTKHDVHWSFMRGMDWEMVLQVGEEVGGCSEFLGPWPTNTGETGGGPQVLCVGAGF